MPLMQLSLESERRNIVVVIYSYDDVDNSSNDATRTSDDTSRYLREGRSWIQKLTTAGMPSFIAIKSRPLRKQ